MGNILIPGGGGGADLDVITADAGDVLAPKVTVDRDGEPVTGTLALSGNAAPWDVRPGRTFYATDPKAKQTGAMAERGAAAFTPGRFNQVIGANQFLVGDQTIWGDWNLAPENIKKGVTIFGVMGSWEGWVPTPQDLYYRGNNIATFRRSTGTIIFQAEQIYFTDYNGYGMITGFGTDGTVVDLTGKSRIIIQGDYWALPHANIWIDLDITNIGIAWDVPVGNNYTITIPINTAIKAKEMMRIRWSNNTGQKGPGVINRIRAE